MWRRTAALSSTPLAEALPHAEQVERHTRTVAAPAEEVWEALAGLTLADVPVAGLLMRVRHLGRHPRPEPLLTHGPVPAQVLHRPSYAAGLVAHRPWAGTRGPEVTASTVAEVAPGWVVTGTEFVLTPLDGRRTHVLTQTRCQATSPDAARRMRRYWRLVGPFSALVRRAMLHSLASRAVGRSGSVAV